MRERPILFSAPMVRAILDGRKTQTRRVAKLNCAGRVALRGRQWHVDDPNAFLACPYGVPGDRLWVRETFCDDWREERGCIEYAADGGMDTEMFDAGCKWRPSIYMPRLASRITLEVVSVRVERLQDLRGRCLDFEAEGITIDPLDPFPHTNRASKLESAFRQLWDSLNAKRGHGWDANPWAWRIEFRRIANAERAG